MGFLKRFFRNVFREGAMPVGTSSFEHLSEEELEAHLGVSRYGDFTLTDAVRPSYDLQVVPSQGYRHDFYRDEQNRTSVPVLMAAVSREHLFETFMDLLDPLGFTVDVVLETSHNRDSNGPHRPVPRAHRPAGAQEHPLGIRRPAAERRLHRPGRAQPRHPAGNPVRRAQAADRLRRRACRSSRTFSDERRVGCDEQMKFITEAEHVHSSSDHYARVRRTQDAAGHGLRVLFEPAPSFVPHTNRHTLHATPAGARVCRFPFGLYVFLTLRVRSRRGRVTSLESRGVR